MEQRKPPRRRRVTGAKDSLPESEIEMDEPEVLEENECRETGRCRPKRT